MTCVIEPCGYGCSSITKRKRTVEEIVEEINVVIDYCDFKDITFVCHSLSGIYALVYMHKYRSKVKGFAGIDCSVPEQIHQKQYWLLNLMMVCFRRTLRDLVWYQYICFNAEATQSPCIPDYEWNADDEYDIRRLNAINLSNKNSFHEMLCLVKNQKTVQNMKFPVPCLMLISMESEKEIKDWKKMHLDVINCDLSYQIVELDGQHYLHYKFVTEIAKDIDEFIVRTL